MLHSARNEALAALITSPVSGLKGELPKLCFCTWQTLLGGRHFLFLLKIEVDVTCSKVHKILTVQFGGFLHNNTFVELPSLSRSRAWAFPCPRPYTPLHRDHHYFDLHQHRLILCVFLILSNGITQGALFCLASFAHHLICEIHPYFCVYERFSVFYCCGQGDSKLIP